MKTETANALLHLKQNYENIKHPLYLSGITQIYKYYKGKLSQNLIEDFLQTVPTYVTHRQVKKPRRNPTYVYYRRYQMQMDMVEISNVKKANKNYAYILTCIDIFTRKAFAKPQYTKTGEETCNNIREILIEAEEKPFCVLFDHGREFENSKVKKLLHELNIKIYDSNTSIHAPFVERFNLTLQRLIYAHMYKNQSFTFYKDLPLIIESYNNRKHRGLPSLSPNEAELAKNWLKILKWNEKKIFKNKKTKKPKYHCGQIVRISKIKTPFSRGYG